MFEKNQNNNAVFGEMYYENIGWIAKNKLSFVLWGKSFHVEIIALSENKSVLVNSDQENTYEDILFSINQIHLDVEETMLNHIQNENSESLSNRYQPTQLIIEQNGSYGICFDDIFFPDCADYPETGFVIRFSVEIEFYDSQSKYLAMVL